MLAMVPRVVKRPPPQGSKPGLGSKPAPAAPHGKAPQETTGSGGRGEGAGKDKNTDGGGSDGAAKKDNDYFKNLFNKGGNL